MKINIKKKFAGALLGLAVVGFSLGSIVYAIGEGQIPGGNIYRIKNITQNRDFAQSQTANKCDVL